MKVLLLAHGRNDFPMNRCCSKEASDEIISKITEDDEIFTVDICANTDPTEIVNLCCPKISVHDGYFDYIIDCGGLYGQYFWYNSLNFWKEMLRIIKDPKNMYLRFSSRKNSINIDQFKNNSRVHQCCCKETRKFMENFCPDQDYEKLLCSQDFL